MNNLFTEFLGFINHVFKSVILILFACSLAIAGILVVQFSQRIDSVVLKVLFIGAGVLIVLFGFFLAFRHDPKMNAKIIATDEAIRRHYHIVP